MFRCFFPDEYLESAYAVNYEKLYQEGVRGLLFDIDNTLVPHGAPADERAIALFERLRRIGFGYCLLSNNQIDRVAPFADEIQAGRRSKFSRTSSTSFSSESFPVPKVSTMIEVGCATPIA